MISKTANDSMLNQNLNPNFKLKKFFAIMLTVAMAFSLVACGGAAGAAKMTMGTGGTAGTYYGYGGVLGQ